MASSIPRQLLEIQYEKAAEKYLYSLPLEHFMEATPQATQRKITLESLDLVHAQRPEVQVFNELLVQYPLDTNGQKLGQVVPDNMVVLWKEPIKAMGSYDIPLQPASPFWMLEYVSKNSKRKDFESNLRKYEQELKVPYYLIFYPDNEELTLYKLEKGKYVSVKPNKKGRYAIAKLDLEVALLEGWMRYWYKGELLQLPADLLAELRQTKRELAEALNQIDQEKQRAEQEKQRAEQEKQRAEQEKQRADQTQQAYLAAEAEIAKLRAQLEQFGHK
jgi:Uma2 family endonuclease